MFAKILSLRSCKAGLTSMETALMSALVAMVLVAGGPHVSDKFDATMGQVSMAFAAAEDGVSVSTSPASQGKGALINWGDDE